MNSACNGLRSVCVAFVLLLCLQRTCSLQLCMPLVKLVHVVQHCAVQRAHVAIVCARFGGPCRLLPLSLLHSLVIYYLRVIRVTLD